MSDFRETVKKIVGKPAGFMVGPTAVSATITKIQDDMVHLKVSTAEGDRVVLMHIDNVILITS